MKREQIVFDISPAPVHGDDGGRNVGNKRARAHTHTHAHIDGEKLERTAQYSVYNRGNRDEIPQRKIQNLKMQKIDSNAGVGAGAGRKDHFLAYANRINVERTYRLKKHCSFIT